MFRTLLKSRFAALGASLTQRSKKRSSSGTKVLLIILFAFLGVYFVAAFGMMFFGFSTVLYPRGDGWQIFALASIVASALCMFGSIFTTKTQIFESGDNELLLSMPIPPRYIFFSRMAILLIVNYGLEALVMLPAMVAYGIVGRYSFSGFLFFLRGILLNPRFCSGVPNTSNRLYDMSGSVTPSLLSLLCGFQRRYRPTLHKLLLLPYRHCPAFGPFLPLPFLFCSSSRLGYRQALLC